jgi:disulfide bond formation protein DsbB
VLPSPRIVNLAGFAICAAMMAYALYQQHAIGLEPCPLCVFQRMAVIGMGIVFLAAAVHGPARRAVALLYGGLVALIALAGGVVAARHAWLQSLPEDQVPACGPGLDYIMNTFPFFQALEMVFAGSGECAEVDWTFLGLAMPAWVLVWCVILGAGAIANALRVMGPAPQVAPDPVQFRTSGKSESSTRP